MKNVLSAAVIGATLLAPAETDALLMDHGPNGDICVMSAADTTGLGIANRSYAQVIKVLPEVFYFQPD